MNEYLERRKKSIKSAINGQYTGAQLEEFINNKLDQIWHEAFEQGYTQGYADRGDEERYR